MPLIRQVPQATIAQPLLPRFHIRSAHDVFGYDHLGWIVTDQYSGLMMWTGTSLTVSEAKQRLLEAAKGSNSK